MDLSEVKEMIRDNGDRLIRKARAHGFRGQTQAGAKRYLIMYWCARIEPVWTSATFANEYPRWSGDQTRSETREQYHARLRLERLTKNYARLFKTRLGLDWINNHKLPHVASVLHSIKVGDDVAVIKHAPRKDYSSERERIGMRGWGHRTLHIPASVELHFRWQAKDVPIVGTVVDESIIMDAQPVEDGYRVRYTRGAKGATVVLETGYWFCDVLVKHADERKARVLALSRALGMAA